MNPFDEARVRVAPEAKASVDLIEGFFDALERMDFESVGGMFTASGLYRDEPSHEADAIGPAAITAKLTHAISGLRKFVMGVDTVVADADRVTSRRTEEWHFPTGEVAKLPVVCIQEINDGKITRWHEFWNMPSLIEQMPPAWMEEMVKRATAESE
jgi:limonene-1,2-epoxide hydrolase